MPEELTPEGEQSFTRINLGKLQSESESESEPGTEPKQSLEARTLEAYNNGESSYWAGYGRPGHSHEYTVHVIGYNANNYMPRGFDDPIKKALGDDWGVMNRGSRIEISFLGDEDGVGWGEPNDELIEPLLERIFNSAPDA